MFLAPLGAPHVYTQRVVHGRLTFPFISGDPLHTPIVRYWYLVHLPKCLWAAGLYAFLTLPRLVYMDTSLHDRFSQHLHGVIVEFFALLSKAYLHFHYRIKLC